MTTLAKKFVKNVFFSITYIPAREEQSMTPVNRNITEFGKEKILFKNEMNLRNTVSQFQLRTTQRHQVLQGLKS